MKFVTTLRAGGVKWAAPFVLLLTLFYYFAGNSAPLETHLGYAPTLIATPMRTLYALAYAVASSLAAWESGRLKSYGVWDLAPARSRARVAGNLLLPVILLSWLVIIAPPIISLVRASTMPSGGSLRLPAMAMLLCIAHAVIGFAIGLKVPRIIAGPLMAVLVWILVAFSRAVQPYWIRHVSGQYGKLGFGEVPAISSLLPPLLLAGGIAAAVSLLWLPLKSTPLRALIAGAVMIIGVFSAYNMTHKWAHTPPLLVGQAPMKCLGSAPKVCMPDETAGSLATVRKDAVSVLNDLHGVVKAPDLITDQIANGRHTKPSTTRTWVIGLTGAVERRDVRYQLMIAAVRFPCEQVDPVSGNSARLWAATVTDQEETYNKRMAMAAQTPEMVRAEQKVQRVVREVLTTSQTEQTDWFHRSLTEACSQGSA